MSAQDLEDLLHTLVVGDITSENLQERMTLVEEMLNFEGKKFVVTKIYSPNQAIASMSVTVKADPRYGFSEKSLPLEFKSSVPKKSVEVLYYDPVEVAAF